MKEEELYEMDEEEIKENLSKLNDIRHYYSMDLYELREQKSDVEGIIKDLEQNEEFDKLEEAKEILRLIKIVIKSKIEGEEGLDLDEEDIESSIRKMREVRYLRSLSLMDLGKELRYAEDRVKELCDKKEYDKLQKALRFRQKVQDRIDGITDDSDAHYYEEEEEE